METITKEAEPHFGDTVLELTDLKASIESTSALNKVTFVNNSLPKHLQYLQPELDEVCNGATELDLPSKNLSANDVGLILTYINEGVLEKRVLTGEVDEWYGLLQLDLYELNLAGNSMTEIPQEICKLSKLTRLSLSGNEIASIPLEIGNLQKLSLLDCSSNKIVDVPVSVSNLSDLRELDLSLNYIENFPNELGKLPLTTLQLGGNRLASISSGITDLTSLHYLGLGGNKIVDIPPQITQMHALWELELGRNVIEVVPAYLNELEELKVLDCSSNNISQISPGIYGLKNLIKLFLGRNKITTLPKEIASMKNLEYLDCSFNGIAKVGTDILNMGSLGRLALEGNKIVDVSPFASANLKHFYAISLDKNPLSDYSLLASSLEGVFTFKELNYEAVVLTKSATISPKQYQNRAVNDPHMFIFLLEDSRKAHDKGAHHTETVAFWDKGNEGSAARGVVDVVPDRNYIVSCLNASQLLDLIDEGGGSLLGAYESTFYCIFHELLKKDSSLSSLSNKSPLSTLKIVSTVAQLTPRYLHLSGSRRENITYFFNIVSSHLHTIIEGMTIANAINYVLPMVQVYQGLNQKDKSIFDDFFRKLCLLLTDQMHNGILEKKQLAGLLLYQFSALNPKLVSGVDADELRSYSLGDISRLRELTFGRNASNPGITHMFFDSNSDGEVSFKNFLAIMGSGLPNDGLTYSIKTILPKTGDDDKNEDDSSYYEISVLKDDQVVHKIYCNDPYRPGGKKYFPGKPDIIVDRGHAGLEEDGLNAIEDTTKLVLIGSCGGNVNLAQALSKNPYIQYIGTTGTGHKAVNDAILLTIISQGCKGETIQWEGRQPSTKFIQDQLWFDSKWPGYQLPNKQIGSALFGRYQVLVGGSH